MNYKLIIDIAKSLLLARWRQTLVAAVGVTFSITMFITLLSFMGGLNELLDGLILNRTPHVRLYSELQANPNQPINIDPKYKNDYNFINSIKPLDNPNIIKNSLAIVHHLEEDDRVIGVAPKITTNVFFTSGSVNVPGSLSGINVEAESKLFMFSDYVVEGDPKSLETIANTIILGKGLAENLLVDIGETVQITTPQGNLHSLKVVGYYQSGLADLDKVQCYTSLITAQKIMNVGSDHISDIQIKIKDLEKAPEVAKEMGIIYETNAIDIVQANAQFDTGSNIRTIISYAVGITLLIVSGFGIYNILNMMIYEKMDSIAILKATGFSGRDVQMIFIVIAISLGLFGGIFGLLFGFLAATGVSFIPFNTEAIPTVKTFPVKIMPTYYLIGLVFSLITTFFAGYFPSRKASKVDPVEIIRGK